MIKKTHVLLVEDDDGLRREMTRLLKASGDYDLTEAVSSAAAALNSLSAGSRIPDLVLLDIGLPDMSGIECLRKIRTQLSDLPVVMLTIHEDSDTLFESLMAGANGYLLKRTPPDQLMKSLQEILDGGAPMSRSIARKVVDYFHRTGASGTFPKPSPSKDLEDLTPREREILASLAKGFSYKEIATDMGISGDTTRKHMSRIYQKLRVHSRTGAILKFLGR